jgi:hypothetical protein
VAGAACRALAAASLGAAALAAVAGPPPEPADAAASAASAASAPAEYVDRVMPAMPPLPLVDDDEVASDLSGLPRSLRIELRGQSSANDQGYERSAWLALRGTADTNNYGALSFDASLRGFDHTQSLQAGTGASFSLYQNGMPFRGGWSASQGLGVIQSLSPKLTGQQAAFFVPTRLIEGASTQWRNDDAGITLQLTDGQTGSYASIGQGSFYGSGDRVAAVGFELRAARPGSGSVLPADWSYAALATTASGSGEQTVPGFGTHAGEASGTGLLQSLRWESNGVFLQGNVLASRNEDLSLLAPGPSSGPTASRLGAWLDGAWQSGAITQRWGLNHLGEGLSWQGTALSGNSQGGYYRWSQTGLRTQWDVQLSSLQPVDRSVGGSTLRQAGVSVRRYIDQELGVGGLFELNGGTNQGVQVSGYSELRRPWANLRIQAGAQTNQGRVVEQQLSADQDWAMPVGERLGTSQALTTTRAGAQDANGAAVGNYGTALELAVVAAGDVGQRMVADLNARISLPLSQQASRLYNVGASAQWRFSPGWSLGAVLSVSRSSTLTVPNTGSPVPSLPGAFATTVYPGSSSRDFWISLRYDFEAGSANVPIGAGGRPGGGGGDVSGVVYLDDTGNARLDALKARAANVTVTLDGRYTTRTDIQGRFEFPFVAAGPHLIMVASDTLPLPWTIPEGKPVHIDVVPRDTTRVEIGATRDPAGATPN